ncbi:MAG: histidine phosphatase family protein [Propioniciclava sp.]|uniref:histidine phosphatase family protein n=1 Tax=Propioniciclava sp. TaxID=2038686 RepID=UPI0039E3989E
MSDAGPGDGLKLWVVRHGRTMLNTTDRVQGWADSWLTPAGEEVARAAGRGLREVPFQAAYSSDSGRALQTARLLLEQNTASGTVPLTDDPRLRELNFGTWEGRANDRMWSAVAEMNGLSYDGLADRITPRMFADSLAVLDTADPLAADNWPAEDYDTIAARVTASMGDIVAHESGRGSRNVLVVSHGLTICVLFDMLIPGFVMPAEGLANVSVSVLSYTGGRFELESLNDLSHVERGR